MRNAPRIFRGNVENMVRWRRDLRSILIDQIRMVGDNRTNGAIGTRDSSLMMMEYVPRHREKKTNEQKRKEFFFHKPINVGETQVHYMVSDQSRQT